MSDQVENLIANGKIIADEIDEAFGDLSSEQLNWKPAPSAWSVGQCIDHLITSNELYMVNIQKVADGTYEPNWWSRIPLVAG